MSKGYKDLKEIKSACNKVDSCAAGSDGFMYKCFPLFAECLIDISNSLIDIEKKLKHLKKFKREPSAYNLHIGKEMKAGKSMQEAVETWKNK